jgi:outer membrane protein OmpA-like peptidoglycan-associated protein
MAQRPAATTNVASSETTTATDANLAANANAVTANAATGAAIPTGAGVVSGVKDNKPMLTVYFGTGKSVASNDMAAAAGALKAYLDANPGAKLAVSGYNDPSGNAALNAELSKKRAQAVAASLATAGIPQGSVELVKPAETTTTTVTPDQARRVEVTVK